MRQWGVQKIIEIRQEESVPSEYFKDDVRTWQKVTLVYPLPENYKDMIGKNTKNYSSSNHTIRKKD